MAPGRVSSRFNPQRWPPIDRGGAWLVERRAHEAVDEMALGEQAMGEASTVLA
jgi:hypothetical protein